jgi:hypothetical protein
MVAARSWQSGGNAVDCATYALSCPAVGFCSGLVAAGVAGINGVPVDATFVSTSDGGSSFVDAPIASSDSMQSIACSTNLDCTVIGTNDAFGMNEVINQSPGARFVRGSLRGDRERMSHVQGCGDRMRETSVATGDD